ncbi:MAG: ATP-binding cassette domain-containing protein, partial [Lachnospiraceae bacterium]|nr:ATP-binding cassette domain-containing protein [Lachnospiraceae bacterium]
MLQIRHLTLIHRGDLRTILDDFSLTVQRGDRVVIIGEEGNGKSTLLRWIFDPALVEDYIDARGTRTTSGEKLVYLPQELPAADRSLPVWDWLNLQDFFANADPGEIARTSSRLRVPQDLFYS